MRRIGPVAMAVALALGACSSGGDDGAAAPSVDRSLTPSTLPVDPGAPPSTTVPSASLPSTATTAPGRSPEGFDRVAVRVLPSSIPELCLWLAAAAAERQQGLMAVTSLGAADGMLFDFGGPGTGEFWMYQTLLPLSIAFYDAAGAFVSSTDMEPCRTASASECARYGAAGPYAYAIEVLQGDLERLGLVAGSRIEVGGACAVA